MAIDASTIGHIRLTVTDIDRSRQFYEQVFDWPVTLEVPADADAATLERQFRDPDNIALELIAEA